MDDFLEGLKPDFGPRYQLAWNDENQEFSVHNFVL
jgi:hypothetical protein